MFAVLPGLMVFEFVKPDGSPLDSTSIDDLANAWVKWNGIVAPTLADCTSIFRERRRLADGPLRVGD